MKNIISTLILILLTTSLSYAKIPQNIKELWADYDQKKEAIKKEIIQEWDKGDVTLQLVRYFVGTFEGDNKVHKPIMAAYYAFPKGKKNLPGIVQLHGGGQRANKELVQYWAKIGYACISINWGEKVLEKKNTPNTDWDGLAAGFLGGKELKHHNDLLPSKYTFSKEINPKNSSWYLVTYAARRAITFLQEEDIVNSDKIGVTGHSMGGKLTVMTAVDPRVKASVPSVGGTGYLYEDLWGLPGSARSYNRDANLDLYQRTISDQASWPEIPGKLLFLGSTNDFNSPTEWIIKGMDLHMGRSQLAMAPHLNHRFTDNTFMARPFWMEAHLKGAFEFPMESSSELILKTENGVPQFKVQPDRSTQLPVRRVEVYYSQCRDPRVRFWADGVARKDGDNWVAELPILDINEPLFAFANVVYEIEKGFPVPMGSLITDELSICSEYKMAFPDEYSANGVQATAKVSRLIDDFSRGWHDWYRLSADNSQHWFFSTRKPNAARWMGPVGAELKLKLKTEGANNKIGVIVTNNQWRNSYTGKKYDSYFAIVDLPIKGEQEILINLKDLKNDQGKVLEDWFDLTEISFTPADKVKSLVRSKTLGKQAQWNGSSPEFLRLEWVGGTYGPYEKPYLRSGQKSGGNAQFEDEFWKEVDRSVEREEMDAKL